MGNKNFTITTELINIKSHFGSGGVKFEAIKPISVIAGPNGEGKSNLIEGILFGLGNFIDRSQKLKKSSNFFKKIVISKTPLIKTTFFEMIFSDLIKKGLHQKKSEINLPERFEPSEMISYSKQKGDILTRINRVSDRYNGIIGESKTNISQVTGYNTTIDKNKLEHLDLVYLNSDNSLSDFFVKYTGQTFSEEIKKIRGNKGQHDYFNRILEYFPAENDRLIQDLESGEFTEKYNDTKFITSSLPTSAKKECILYLIGLLKEIHKKKEDWLSVILIDEFEAGLHISRQKKIVDALLAAISNNETLKSHVKLIISTHSPVIYSEMNKNPDLVDIYFVLREKNKPSYIYKKGDNVDNYDLVEKRILSELGLNIYELPSKILFVEGPTDKLFFDEIFTDVFIQPFYSGNINKMVRDFISAFPIVRSKEYKVVVDSNAKKQVSEQINEIRDDTTLEISFHVNDIGYNSLEEFIFEIDLGSGVEVSKLWDKVNQKINEWNERLDEEEKIQIDISSARNNLEPDGSEGLKTFLATNFKKNKKVRHMYSLIGRRYREFLSEKNIEKLRTIGKEAGLKFKYEN